MFKHEKMLFHPVSVEKPNPQYAVLLQEQLGGGNGEFKPAPYFNIIRESGEKMRRLAEIVPMFLNLPRSFIQITDLKPDTY